MKIRNFGQILIVALALSAYRTWLLPAPEAPTTVAEMQHCAAAAGIPELTQAEAESLWHEPSTLFVDVRPAFDYEVSHIDKAVSLPEEELDKRFAQLKPRLQEARTVVLYCKSADCAQSLRVALRLRMEGLKQVQIYQDGWNQWYDRGLPITSGKPNSAENLPVNLPRGY